VSSREGFDAAITRGVPDRVPGRVTTLQKTIVPHPVPADAEKIFPYELPKYDLPPFSGPRRATG